MKNKIVLEAFEIFKTFLGHTKLLIFMGMITITTLSVILFGYTTLIIWGLMSIILFSYKDELLDFIIMDFNFLIIPTEIDCTFEYINVVNNNQVVNRLKLEFKNIVFIIDKSNKLGGILSDFTHGLNLIIISEEFMGNHNQKDFEIILFHEIGHIEYQHSKQMRVWHYIGYIIFIIFPLIIPVYWFVVKYVSRKQELMADNFAALNTSTNDVLSLFKDHEKRRVKPNSILRKRLERLQYLTFSRHPSYLDRIKKLTI